MRPSHVLGMLLGLSFAAARTAAQEPDAGKDAAKAAAVDLYGDPLPPGAVARLGSARLRQAYLRSLCFTRDGRILISAHLDYPKAVWHLWHGKTGKLIRRIDPSIA